MWPIVRVLLLAAVFGLCLGPVYGQVRLAPEEAEKLLIEKPRPDYPALAKAARAEGIVKVETIVSEQGVVISAKAISGHALLRYAAETAAKKLKYRAHMVDGKPVRFVTNVDVLFPPAPAGPQKDEDDQEQFARNLGSKYGTRVKAYEIRPGIMMTVKFDESGQVSVMGIERLVFHDTFIDVDSEIPRQLIQEIVDELVPKAKRGAKLKTLEPLSMPGETVISGEDYWNVSVTYFGKRSGDGGSNIVGIRIAWKSRN